MKIKAIDLSKLRNAEFIQFIRQTVELTKDNDSNALLITPQLTTLETKLTELENLHKQSLASELTSEIELLDDRRDKAIIGISLLTEGFSYATDSTVKTAAEQLRNSIKSYGYGGGIARLNYNAETASIISIINDWENNATLTDAIASLQLTPYKEELKTSNIQFGALYKKRTQEYAEITPESLRDARLTATPVYYTFRDYLAAHQTINSTAEGTKLIKEINALIDQYNALLTTRVSKQQSNTEVSE